MSSPSEETQLMQIQQWIETRATRGYKRNDKHRFAVLEYDGQSVVMTLEEARDWINESDEHYELSERWMTLAQYEKLPEFEGF